MPKFDKIAVLTPCGFFSILGLQIDENARVLQLFVKFDKNAFLVNFGFKYDKNAGLTLISILAKIW